MNTLPVEQSSIQMVVNNIESAEVVHKRICNNFEKVERTLYDICIDLNSIRDNKYYKSLGYDTFEAYCLKCFNIARRTAYRYISIAENLSSDFVSSRAQIGVNKLGLLSRLTEIERTEILETTDIEHTSVKKLEEKSKEIKQARELTKIKDGDYGYFRMSCFVENQIKKVNISYSYEVYEDTIEDVSFNENVLLDDKGEYIVGTLDMIQELPFDFACSLNLELDGDSPCIFRWYQKDFEKVLEYYNSKEIKQAREFTKDDTSNKENNMAIPEPETTSDIVESSHSQIKQKFKVGVYGGLNITKIDSTRTSIVFDNEHYRTLYLSFDGEHDGCEYFILDYIDFLNWGGSTDLIDFSSYCLSKKDDRMYIVIYAKEFKQEFKPEPTINDVEEISQEHGIILHQDDTSNVENTSKTKIKKVSLDYSVLDFIYKTLMQSKNSLFIDKFDKHEIYRNLDLVTDILLQHFPKLYK